MSTPLEREERDLLAEIAAGRADAKILEERYKPRLLWFARVMGIPSEDGPDLVQDVLLIAIREIRSGRFRRDSAIITWLDGILKNKIKDFWRAQERRRSLFTPLETKLVVPSPSRWDRDIDIRTVLERMPVELRSILLLSEAEGLTVDEISRKLKKRPGTIGRKLADSKRIFRDLVVEARLGATKKQKAGAAAVLKAG